MTESATAGPLVAVLLPFPDDGELAERLQAIDPNVRVQLTPYAESMEVRAEKGKFGGRLAGSPAEGLELPEVDDATRAIWAETDIVISIDSPDAHLDLFPKLTWFQAASAGLDHIDADGLVDRGVRVSTGSGIAAVSIAEFVFARYLQVYKQLRVFDQQQRDRVWEMAYGTEINGLTMVIAGFGAIGREVARRARAFGITVLATRRSASQGDTDPDVDELHPAADLASLLPRADMVLCALPGSPETTNLFDAEMIGAMKPGCLFQNVGRGTHVVEADLLAALTSGHLGAALLDVTLLEPVPEDSPLWDAPNLYLSPHSAVSVDNYVTNTWQLAAENLAKLQSGEPLRNEYRPSF